MCTVSAGSAYCECTVLICMNCISLSHPDNIHATVTINSNPHHTLSHTHHRTTTHTGQVGAQTATGNTAHIIVLLLLSHVESDEGGNAVDVNEEVALILPHLGELQQKAEIFRQVLAVRAYTVLNLKHRDNYDW